MSSDTLNFEAETEVVSGSVTKMELYADGKLLASTSRAPWFSASKLPAGREVTVRAVAYDDSGGKGFSNRIYLRVSDGSPDVTLKAPGEKSKFLTADAIELKASTLTYDSKVTKIEFFADGNKVGESAGPDQAVIWRNPAAGKLQIGPWPLTTRGRTGKSDPLQVIVRGSRPADALKNLARGTRFRYYEGHFATLPDFDKLGSMDFGSQKDFALGNGCATRILASALTVISRSTRPAPTHYTRSNDGYNLASAAIWRRTRRQPRLGGTSGRGPLEPGYHKQTLDYAQDLDALGLEVSYGGPGIPRMRAPRRDRNHEPDPLKSLVSGLEVNISQKVGKRRGRQLPLRAKVEPSATWSRRGVWSSEIEGWPRSSQGYVTAHAEGKANIVAASSDGSRGPPVR